MVHAFGQDMMNMYLADRKDAHCSIHSNASNRLPHYYTSVLYQELYRLEHVTVVIDPVFKRTCCIIPDNDPVRLPKEEAVQHVVQFLQVHKSIFPGCLKTFQTAPDRISFRPSLSCTIEIGKAVDLILPPYKPTYLPATSWAQVSAHRHSVELSCVKEVFNLDPVVAEGLLLQRCRVLTRNDLRFLVPGSFEWAVQEKEVVESLGQSCTMRRSLFAYREMSSIDSPSPAPLTHGLFQLKGSHFKSTTYRYRMT
ncbi:hypothetical protein BG015_002352 [Linnemannia schmuckeri]|uniref:Uncharacterized protein n=1 Tax=Linnemannia schmuckeri TaxID=64567 RepID=A0A9P5RNP1_9FUNG|nr:hypothetical protein BG015_002352 [Linnemannia schmuckeri]